jgi:hypothetical protein
MRLAREGDAKGIGGYLRTDEFLAAFIGLDAGRRQSVMRCYGKAEALCEAKARHPLVSPRPIDAKRSHKASWGDPQIARLADAYAHTGGDDDQAARILGVTLGSARLAKRRHLGPGTTCSHRQKAVASRRNGNSCYFDGQRHGLRGGFQRPSDGDCQSCSKMRCKERAVAR